MSEVTLDRVKKCIAEVLAVEPDQILAESRLMDDLGADSLDLVELMYVLEQEFDLRLDADDLSLTAQLGLSEDEIHEAEVLTPRALELLKERFPHAESLLVPGATRRQLAGLLTVHTVCQAMETRVGRN